MVDYLREEQFREIFKGHEAVCAWFGQGGRPVRTEWASERVKREEQVTDPAGP